MTAFLALGIILMAVFTHMGLENFLEGAKNLLLTGIRFLFSLLPQEEEAELIPEPAPESSGSSGMPPLGEGETSQIMMAISNFLVAFMKIRHRPGRLYYLPALEPFSWCRHKKGKCRI